MNSLIDIRTALLLNAVVGLIFCLYMVHIYRTRPTYPGFLQWTIASLFVFSTMALIYLRDTIPDWASVAVSNALGLASMALIARGLAHFLGRTMSRWWLSLPVLTAIVSSVVFTYQYPDVRARIIAISILMLLPLIQAIALARSAPASLPGLSVGWIVASLGGMMLWLTARIVLTFLFEDERHDFFSSSVVQGVFLVCYSAGNIAILLGLLVLHSQRTEGDLKQALDEVRTLRGVIPICAACKKIRDDRGAWNQLEAYISRHSEAEFTHGYCPDCSRHLLDTLPEI